MNMRTFMLLLGGALCLFQVSLQASEASKYCNDLYSDDGYESEERSEYIQECLQSYAGHDDGYSDDDDGQEGVFDGGVNDLIETIDE